MAQSEINNKAYRLKELHAGIIGCGQIAGGYNLNCKKGESLTHACSYKQIEGVRITAICDPSAVVRDNFAKKWNVKKVYVSHEEMLMNEKLDIVSICSPAEYHLDAFKSISKNSSIKGIFCEKPLSFDLKEAKKIAELAKGRIVALNYFRRWNPTLLSLKKNLEENLYGSVSYISVRYTKGLLTNGSHLVDLLYWYFGKPYHIDKYHTHNPQSNDPGVDFKLSFLNGLNAVFLHVPSVPYTYIEIDIHTDMGKISIKQRGQKITWSEIVEEPSYNTFNILKEQKIIETEWKDCPTRAIKELIGVIRNGGSLSSSIKNGIDVSEICEKIIKSK